MKRKHKYAINLLIVLIFITAMRFGGTLNGFLHKQMTFDYFRIVIFGQVSFAGLCWLLKRWIEDKFRSGHGRTGKS